MSTYLLLGDSHLRHSILQKIIDSVSHDFVISLGDMWDQFADSPEQNSEAAKWVVNQLENNPKYIQIGGNHDWGYLYDRSYCVMCSGFTRAKSLAINKILKVKHKEQFRLFYYIKDGNWLISHSGISQGLLGESVTGDIEKLQIYCNNALENLKANLFDPIFGAGRHRGGIQQIGGIIWEDFRSIIPLAGYNQIVGHTIVDKPMIKSCNRHHKLEMKEFNNGIVSPKNPKRLDKGGICINIDTDSHHYALITDGVFTIHETPKEFFDEYNKEQSKRLENKMLNDYANLLKSTSW